MKKIELRVGTGVTAIRKRSRCQFRRILWISATVNGDRKVTGGQVCYTTGGDWHYTCSLRQFIRWTKMQRKQKKVRRVPADMLSVQPQV